MKNIRLLVSGLVIVIVLSLVYVYLRDRSKNDADTLRVSGNIEVTQAELAFRIGGHVEKRLVDEGEKVRSGSVVAVLDKADLERDEEMKRADLATAQAALAELQAGTRPEEVAGARASARKAEAFVQELKRGSRPQEIEAAKARVAAARAEKTRLEVNFHRAEELFRTQTISAQEFDLARESYRSAAANLKETEDQLSLAKEGPRLEEIEQAQAALAQARSQLDLAVNGPRKETIEQAVARVEQARAALGLSRTRLGYATLVSPLAGIVLSKDTEPGEYVAPGTPIVTVADVKNVWLRAYVSETDLGRVKIGQRVQVTTDTYPGKIYDGRLSFISAEAEFTPKNVQTEKERVKLVYRVKIDIPNPSMELKPGMPADARIMLLEETGGTK